ncbi:MAG: apolipoprotein N-acyltransferase [Planctomycetota bacterium]
MNTKSKSRKQRKPGGAGRKGGASPRESQVPGDRAPAAPAVVDAMSTHRRMLALVVAAALLKSLIFAPVSFWPLAFVCLVPWIVMTGSSSLAPRVYLHSYVFGLLFFVFNVRWMYHATGAGYVALAVYLAAYMPAMACAIRHVIRRRRWPLAICFPLIWVGGEMTRAVALSGFPWFFLSHSVYKVLPIIQISDVVGAYGVSFVVASVNGAVADWLLLRLDIAGMNKGEAEAGKVRLGGVVAGVLMVSILGYGWIQLGRDTTSVGPRVAIIQGDFRDTVDPDEMEGHDRTRGRDRMLAYLALVEEAGAASPDLFLLPESPWPMVLNREAPGMRPLSRESFSAIQQISTRLNAYVVTGCASYERHPYDLLATDRYFNSAAVFYPDARAPGRYDKRHLVYFGEVVPFRFTKLHWLYLRLNALMPFSDGGKREYSLFRGTSFVHFEMTPQSQPDRTFRFGVPICYEDVMPYVSREFAIDKKGQKRVDMLLNISNDGWFGRGVQQPQHLAICVFRAVENRLGIARSVNTGGSAFIKPTGEVHDFPRDPGDRWPGAMGYAVANVEIDSRVAFYSRYGDWFALACAFAWLALFLDYWIIRIRTHAEPSPT